MLSFLGLSGQPHKLPDTSYSSDGKERSNCFALIQVRTSSQLQLRALAVCYVRSTRICVCW